MESQYPMDLIETVKDAANLSEQDAICDPV